MQRAVPEGVCIGTRAMYTTVLEEQVIQNASLFEFGLIFNDGIYNECIA